MDPKHLHWARKEAVSLVVFNKDFLDVYNNGDKVRLVILLEI